MNLKVFMLCCLTPTVLAAATQTTAQELNLYTRLLSEELACNFDNITFCGLHNNGGWSFKQSLLELVHKLTNKNPNASLPPARPNHFVCADWGVATQRTSSSSTDAVSGRVATLEVFTLPPSPRQPRQTSGKVFYVGVASSNSVDPPMYITEDMADFEEGQGEEESGLCLEMDVRLSSDFTDGPSKLTVKFRSLTQTIEAFPESTSLPQPATPTSTMAPSLQQRVAFLTGLASRILWPSSTASTQPQLQHPAGPPLDRWLHFTLPIDPKLLATAPSDSPLHFALYGHSGVCVDSILFSKCDISFAAPSLSWPPDNTLNLSSIPPTNMFARGDSTTLSPFNPLLTGAFFFTCLLAVLVSLLIVVLVVSVACGKRRRLCRKRAGGKAPGFEKGKGVGDAVAPTHVGAALLRSPSISSLPGAAVYQRPIDELLQNVEDDVEESRRSWRPPTGHASLDTKNRYKRPQRRPPRRALSVDSRLQSKFVAPYDVKAGAGVVQRRHRKHGKKAAETVSPSNACQRLSLLLSINEENELILVAPTSANPPSTRASPQPVARSDEVPTTAAEEAPNTSSNITNSSSRSSEPSSGTATTATTSSGNNTSVTASKSSHPLEQTAHLSLAEAEATLQEMAASVAHLGEGTEERCSTATSTSSGALPPLYEEAVLLLDQASRGDAPSVF